MFRARGGLVTAIAAAAFLGFVFVLPEPGDRRIEADVEGAFAIRDVRVFDGERIVPRATVVVRDGLIAAIGTDAPVPEGAEIVDGRGRTLLPGLIDAHVHPWGAALGDALNFGVTTALGMFEDPAMSAELRPLRESLAPVAHADLYSAGWLATAPGGHGTQFGLKVPTLTSPAEAPAWVDARFREGSDYIKIVYEPKEPGGFGPPFPSLDAATLEALIAAAHARERLAVVHISRLEPARTAIGAGADGLVHVFADRRIDEAFVRLVRERGAFVTPTLAVTAAFAGEAGGAELAADPRVRPFLSPEQRATLTLRLPETMSWLKPQIGSEATDVLHAAGVDVLAGSDAPNPGTGHGISLHHELRLLVASGLEPAAALAAATSVPARRFGLDDRGRIAPGLRADLVLVAGDPTTDIGATLAIERIWKNGAEFPRKRYARTSE